MSENFNRTPPILPSLAPGLGQNEKPLSDSIVLSGAEAHRWVGEHFGGDWTRAMSKEMGTGRGFSINVIDGTVLLNGERAAAWRTWVQAIARVDLGYEILAQQCASVDYKSHRPLTASDTPSAPQILGEARKHIEDRAATYDSPEGERSVGATVKAFNIITGRDGIRALSESEGWLLMQILKDVRDRARPAGHRDSLEDGTAYSALKAEARLKGL